MRTSATVDGERGGARGSERGIESVFKTDACLPWGLIVMGFYSNEGQSRAAGRCETNSNQGGVRVDIVKYNKPFFILGRTMFHGEGCALMMCSRLAPSPCLRDIDVSGQ